MNEVSMRRFLTLVCLLLGATLSLQAQKLHGVVLGKEGKPLELANVLLINKTDSTLINGVVTDNHGNFDFREVPPLDSFFVRVSLLG